MIHEGFLTEEALEASLSGDKEKLCHSVLADFGQTTALSGLCPAGVDPGPSPVILSALTLCGQAWGPLESARGSFRFLV